MVTRSTRGESGLGGQQRLQQPGGRALADGDAAGDGDDEGHLGRASRRGTRSAPPTAAGWRRRAAPAAGPAAGRRWRTSSRSIRSPSVASRGQLARRPAGRSWPVGEGAPRVAVEDRVGRDGAARPDRHGAHRAVRPAPSRGSPARVAAGPPGRPAVRAGAASRVSGVPTRPGLLDCIERYFAARARCPDARIEPVGAPRRPGRRPGRGPTRPGRGPAAGPVTAGRRRRPPSPCRQAAGLPAALEWIAERDPGLAAGRPRRPGSRSTSCRCWSPSTRWSCCCPPGVRLYLVGADDPRAAALPAGRRSSPSPTRAAPADDPATPPPDTLARRRRARTAVLRERIAAGRTVMMVAVENGEPVAVGSHQPVDVDGTEISEIVGVATLPRLRGRGLGAGLASALVAHARETADTGLPGRRGRRRRAGLRAGRLRPAGTTAVAERRRRLSAARGQGGG